MVYERCGCCGQLVLHRSAAQDYDSNDVRRAHELFEQGVRETQAAIDRVLSWYKETDGANETG